MHQLTIDHDNEPVAVTDHPDFDTAHRVLLKYVVRADYYLRPVQITAARTRYQLLRLPDLDDPTPARHPRVTGSATITQLPDTELPVSAPSFTARDAQRGITEHAHTWRHGPDADPGYDDPTAVLTMAHGEARRHLRAGTLLHAARPGDGHDCASTDRAAPEAVRRNALSCDSSPDNPAAIAHAVAQLAPAGTNDHHSAALIWYCTLIRWGTNAP